MTQTSVPSVPAPTEELETVKYKCPHCDEEHDFAEMVKGLPLLDKIFLAAMIRDGTWTAPEQLREQGIDPAKVLRIAKRELGIKDH